MTAWILFLTLLMVVGELSDQQTNTVLLDVMWLPWLVPVVLFARAHVIAQDDVLTYRGPLRTRFWARRDIAGFSIGPFWGSPLSNRIEMRTIRGERVPFMVNVSWRPRTTRLRRGMAALENWRSHPGPSA